MRLYDDVRACVEYIVGVAGARSPHHAQNQQLVLQTGVAIARCNAHTRSYPEPMMTLPVRNLQIANHVQWYTSMHATHACNVSLRHAVCPGGLWWAREHRTDRRPPFVVRAVCSSQHAAVLIAIAAAYG